MNYAPTLNVAARRVVLGACAEHAARRAGHPFGLSSLAARLLVLAASRGAIEAKEAASELCASIVHIRRVAGPDAALLTRGYLTVTPRRPGVPNTLKTLPEGLLVATALAEAINESWEVRP